MHVLLLALLSQAPQAADGLIIPPGREAIVRSLLERALGDGVEYSASIDGGLVRVRLLDPGSPPGVLILGPPNYASDDLGLELAPAVFVERAVEHGPSAATRHADLAWRLAVERDLNTGALWTPVAPPFDPPSHTAETGRAKGRQGRPSPEAVGQERRPVAWLVVFGLLLGIAVVVVRRWRVAAVERRGVRHALFVAWVACSSFIASEAVVRWIDFPWPTVPGPADLNRHGRYKINELGLREPWSQPPKRRQGEVRVALLGDSFAFGESVGRAQAMPAVIEELLRAARPETPVRVFNLGRRGDDTHAEAVRYRRLHDVLDVDILVLVAYVNDFPRMCPASTLAEIYDVGQPGFFSEHSLLIAHLRSRVRYLIMRQRSIAYYRSTALADLTGEFRPMGDELLALRRFAEERGVRFFLVFFPWLYSLEDYPLEETHTQIARFASDNGLTLLDLLDVFRGGEDEQYRVSPADEHPNARAHRMASEAIVELLLPVIDAPSP